MGCGFGAVVFKANVPDDVPAVNAVKPTVTACEPFTAIVNGNAPAFMLNPDPVRVASFTVREVFPVLYTVRFWRYVAPIGTAPKLRSVGRTAADVTGEVPFALATIDATGEDELALLVNVITPVTEPVL